MLGVLRYRWVATSSNGTSMYCNRLQNVDFVYVL